MADSAYKQTVLELERRRLKSADIYEQRLDEIFAKIPKIQELRQEISQSSIMITKALLHGGDAEKLINELKDGNQHRLEYEKYLLKTNGYDENYLKDFYFCNLCEDKGFIENKKCKCFDQLMIEKLYQISNIREVLKVENFDTFNLEYFSDTVKIDGITPKTIIKDNYKMAQRFVIEFDDVYRNLFMYGNVGLGKTFLCNCIAKDLLDQGHSVFYVSAIELFKKLEDYRFYRNENTKHEEFISYLTKADLLIIDDLGTEVQTQFTSSELFNIINKRHTDRKHTIISTNIPMSEIEKIYSHRLESRFFGNFELIKFIGEDIRLLKKFN